MKWPKQKRHPISHRVYDPQWEICRVFEEEAPPKPPVGARWMWEPFAVQPFGDGRFVVFYRRWREYRDREEGE